jgi:O-antigen/teichoic acid export membrane protein
MLSFVSWNLIGSIAGVAKEQGINVLLNIYFGAAINAARGIAYQVMNSINGFVSNFQLAMNPQIIKLFSSNEKEEMFKLVLRGGKYSFLLLFFLSLPVIIEAPFILNIWLIKVPDYTVIFLRLILVTSLIDSLSGTLITSMHASGKVRDYQIVVGGISLFTLPVAWLFLRNGYQPYSAMAVSLCISIICHFARLLLLKKSIGFPVKLFLVKVTFKCFLVSIFSMILPILAYISFSINWFSFLLICFISSLSILIITYFVGLSNDEKSFFVLKIHSLLVK